MNTTNRVRRAEKLKSRFDVVEANDYATVGNLLREINAEDISSEGSTVTFKSLERTLRFIKEISGVSIESAGDKVNVNTLKVIKLLFKKSDKRVGEDGERINSRNIFGLLQRPKDPEKNADGSLRKDPGRATMESCTGTTIPRDPEGRDLIGELVSALSVGLDPEKLAVMEAVLSAPNLYGIEQAEALAGTCAGLNRATADAMKLQGTWGGQSDAERLLDHIALGTGAVEDLLSRQFAGDDRLLASAYQSISSEIRRQGLTRLARTEVPVNEALYVHARTLGLQHFIRHHRAYIADIRVDDIRPINDEVQQFCERIGGRKGFAGGPCDPVEQLVRFEEFAQENLSDLMSLVGVATGLPTPERAHQKNVVRAMKIAQWAAYRRYDRAPPRESQICVLDVVAALCSVRYQQEEHTEYEPYWEGQRSQGKSPERMLDASGRYPDTAVQQGVFLLYYTRYKHYLAAFTGTAESNRAFADFESCRFDAYLEAMQSRSLVEFQAATLGIDNLGLILALDIVYANVASAPIAAEKPCD